MISYSVPNHVTPVFYYIISINNFYFSLLYRQVRISHQALIHRMCNLTSLTDRPHDKRLSSVHIACCKYIFHACRICALCRRHVRPCIQLDAKRICNIFFCSKESCCDQNQICIKFRLGTSDITMRPVFSSFLLSNFTVIMPFKLPFLSFKNSLTVVW